MPAPAAQGGIPTPQAHHQPFARRCAGQADMDQAKFSAETPVWYAVGSVKKGAPQYHSAYGEFSAALVPAAGAASSAAAPQQAAQQQQGTDDTTTPTASSDAPAAAAAATIAGADAAAASTSTSIPAASTITTTHAASTGTTTPAASTSTPAASDTTAAGNTVSAQRFACWAAQQECAGTACAPLFLSAPWPWPCLPPQPPLSPSTHYTLAHLCRPPTV